MSKKYTSPDKTLPDTSQTPTPSSQSRRPLSTTGALGSKYLVSMEEQQRFARDYGSELVITMGNSNLGKK